MRRGVAVGLLVALVSALLVALAPPAAACSCAVVGPPPVAFEGVALGRTGGGDFDDRWAFKETRTIKGTPIDVRAVNIATGQESACGFERTPVVGAFYRIEAYEYEGRYFANYCGGSMKRLARATDDARTNAYVTAVHEDLLGRPPDGATVDYWSTYLDAGGSRRTMVEDRHRSRRSSRRLAEAAADLWLDRELDADERRYLVRVLRQRPSGYALERLVYGSLVLSLEPDDDEAWLEVLFQRRLDRSPTMVETDGLLSWNDREETLASFLFSKEVRRLDVTEAFDTFLGRAPTEDELTRWGRLLRTTLERLDFIRELLVSEEYRRAARQRA